MINGYQPLIQCSLCLSRFPSEEFQREHRFICENNINRCPYCQQLIRKPILIYPYENNYISPKETACIDVSLSLTRFNNGTYYQIPSYRSQQSIKIREIFNCLYCGEEFYQENINKHQEYCLKNPKNSLKKYQKQSNPIHKTNYLFCKYCQEFFQENHYNQHKDICQYKFEELQRELSYRREKSSDLFIRCSHCGILFTKAGLKIHQTNYKISPSYHSNYTISPHRQSFYT